MLQKEIEKGEQELKNIFENTAESQKLVIQSEGFTNSTLYFTFLKYIVHFKDYDKLTNTYLNKLYDITYILDIYIEEFVLLRTPDTLKNFLNQYKYIYFSNILKIIKKENIEKILSKTLSSDNSLDEITIISIFYIMKTTNLNQRLKNIIFDKILEESKKSNEVCFNKFGILNTIIKEYPSIEYNPLSNINILITYFWNDIKTKIDFYESCEEINNINQYLEFVKNSFSLLNNQTNICKNFLLFFVCNSI